MVRQWAAMASSAAVDGTNARVALAHRVLACIHAQFW